MDFDWEPGQLALREEIRDFLAGVLPPEWGDHHLGWRDRDPLFEATLNVTAGMAERGWLTMHWPEEYGGRGASIWDQTVMKEEMWLHDEPRGQQYMATNFVGPCIMIFGTEEQKRKHLPAISSGRGLWCQGFSEPDAGSDLASLTTRADRDGETYVINGSKIWTSYANRAEWCLLAVRTNQDVPKHKGLSMFLLDLKTPGVTIVPIEAMSGHGDLHQVFFDDVRVPADCRLGAEDDGWNIIVRALNFERLGPPRFAGAIRWLDLLREYARGERRDGEPLFDDPAVRERYGELRIDAEVSKLIYYLAASEEHHGAQDLTFLASMSLVKEEVCNQDVAAFGMELLGDLSNAEGAAPFGGKAAENWRAQISYTIGGGAIEVQRNVIAQRGLGLPR